MKFKTCKPVNGYWKKRRLNITLRHQQFRCKRVCLILNLFSSYDMHHQMPDFVRQRKSHPGSKHVLIQENNRGSIYHITASVYFASSKIEMDYNAARPLSELCEVPDRPWGNTP